MSLLPRPLRPLGRLECDSRHPKPNLDGSHEVIPPLELAIILRDCDNASFSTRSITDFGHWSFTCQPHTCKSILSRSQFSPIPSVLPILSPPIL